ncbi:MAG: hypothetical protein HY202_09315 [Nitrospirae bacterium]|nr:hypothetical protein [Nitrospirota bacterium]
MGYEVLIEALLNEGKNKCREIARKAGEEAETILREAGERSAGFEREKRSEIKKKIEERRARILSRGRMESRRVVLEAKHEILSRAFNLAAKRLKELAAESDGTELHRLFWTRRVQEAIGNGPSQELQVFLPEDAPKDLERVLKERGIKVEMVKDPYLRFGFKAVSDGGERAVIDSYPARLEKLQGELFIDLGRIFFGREEPEGSFHG